VPDETNDKPDAKIDPPKAEEAPTTASVEATAAAPDAPLDEKADEEDDDGEADESVEEDAFRPEAIAKRIDKLGTETEVDRMAREEELKLAERRRQAKKKGKRGLESAATKRLAKIGDKPVKRTVSAVPANEADPLLERTAKMSEWLRDHQRTVGAAVLGFVVVALGFGGYTWWQKKRESDASVLLAEAVADERGTIGDPDKDEKKKDPRPVFKTAEERRDAALTKYKTVVSKYSGTGAAILARLAEGALDLDKQDGDAALAAFNDVKASPLAGADGYVRGRALEGVGFAYELQATTKPAERAKWLDEAQKAFGELEKDDAPGFKELAMYHEARVMEAKGDKPGAIELLKKLHGKLVDSRKPDEFDSFPYLDTAVSDKLASLDPTAVPHKPAAKPGGAGGLGPAGIQDLLGPDGKIDMNDPRVQAFIQQMQQSQGGGPAGGAGGTPPMPRPAPEKK
jgi:hypothetical protein